MIINWISIFHTLYLRRIFLLFDFHSWKLPLFRLLWDIYIDIYTYIYTLRILIINRCLWGFEYILKITTANISYILFTVFSFYIHFHSCSWNLFHSSDCYEISIYVAHFDHQSLCARLWLCSKSHNSLIVARRRQRLRIAEFAWKKEGLFLIHTMRNLSEILLNQTQIRLTLPFYGWFVIKRTSVWFQINREMVNTIWFQFDFIRFWKDFSVCTGLCDPGTKETARALYSTL